MLPLISITGQQKQTESTYCQAEKDNHAADVPSASPLSSSGQPQSFNGPNESAVRPLSQRRHTDFTPKIFVSVHSETHVESVEVRLQRASRTPQLQVTVDAGTLQTTGALSETKRCYL